MIETAQPESTGDPVLDELLARHAESSAALANYDLTSLVRFDQPSIGLHAAARRVEQSRRALAGFDTGYVTALEVGDEPRRFACSSTANFLRQQLRLTRTDARRRVAIAHACAPRSGMSGEPLPPQRPRLAAAIAAGEVSADHAALTLELLDSLPATASASHGEWAEQQLVNDAGQFEPAHLRQVCRRILAHVDPDGQLRDIEHAHANRSLWVQPNPIGAGGRIGGQLDVELLELLHTVLGPLAKPAAAQRDADDPGALGVGERDPRTSAERLHDALRAALMMVLNSGDLPASGGTPTTTVFHIREDRLSSEYGLAISDNGNLVPIPDALAIADQSAIYVLIESCRGVPLWLGRASRIATPGQSIALASRDRGCSLPGCDRPPGQCQRHHVRDWLHGGPTDIDNLTLVCSYHHREFERRGWQVVMRDGLPWWIPPRWIDPEQKPIRNHAHDDFLDTS